MSFPVAEATVGFSPAPAHTKGGATFRRGAGIGGRLRQPGAAGAGTKPSPISSATNSSPEPPPRFSKTLIRSVSPGDPHHVDREAQPHGSVHPRNLVAAGAAPMLPTQVVAHSKRSLGERPSTGRLRCRAPRR